MAFLRFSRDKRGVEHYYLGQPTTNRRGKVRPRVLYWYRTPPDVKVGREPFDPEVRRALEAQNPDVSFDWRAIVETPIPSADADKWRERRRAERAAKHAAATEESAEAGAEIDSSTEGAEPGAAVPAEPPAAVASGGEQQNARPAPGDASRKRRRRRRGSRGGAAPGSSAPPATPAAPAGGGDASGE